jgi:[NiFe] hydrogenase assembly HybE family chaperone
MAEGAKGADPGSRIAAVFREIALTRMAGLPICNPALGVDALGFRPWAGGWVGVLIAPWSMSLIYLPDGQADWAGRPSGSPQGLALPAGDFELLTAAEGRLGPYLTGSLFSPMGGFADMDQARAVAQAVIDQVFAPPETPDRSPGPVPAGAEPPQSPGRVLSRRGFLGAFLDPERR